MQSSKIRERSNALTELEDINFHSETVRESLNRKSCLDIIQALSSFIAIDAVAFRKSNTQAEMRLLRASHMMDMLISVIASSNQLIAKFRQKHYDIILDALLANILMSDSNGHQITLECVATNCTKALNRLFAVQDFKDHLSLVKYESIISTTLDALELLTSGSSVSPINANDQPLLVELLKLFGEFVAPKRTSALNLFTNANTSAAIDNYYIRFTQILIDFSANVFSRNRRESQECIIIFHIINRCLIDLSTLDVKLCLRLSKIGFGLLLDLKSVTFPRLIDEIAAFINLAADFLDLRDFPKLVGDNWSINERGVLLDSTTTTTTTTTAGDEYEEDDSVIVPGSSISTSSIRSSVSDSSSYIKQVSHLYGLISILYDLMQGEAINIGSEDLGTFIFHSNQSTSVFKGAYVYLSKPAKKRAWLYHIALVRILQAYFTLKDSSTKSQPGGQIVKRRRIATHLESRQRFLTGLEACDTIAGFITYLMDSASLKISSSTDSFDNNSLSLLGLKLFVFTCNYNATFATKKRCSTVIDQICQNGRNLVNTIIKQLVVSDSTLNVWALYSLSELVSIIKEYGSDKQIVSSDQLNKAFKYSLEFLKDSETCKAACFLICKIYQVLKLYSSNGYTFTQSKTVLQQYETVISLSEVSGPALICKEAVFFWIYTYFICRDYKFRSISLTKTAINNATSTHLFSSKVYNWLVSKFNQLGQLSSDPNMRSTVMLIKLLEGQTVSIDYHEINVYIESEDIKLTGTIPEMYLQYDTKSFLRDYILLDQSKKVLSVDERSSIPATLVINDNERTDLIHRFQSFIDRNCFDKLNKYSYSWWIAALDDPVFRSKNDSYRNPLLEDTSKKQLLSLSQLVEAINSVPLEKKDVLKAIHSLVDVPSITREALKFMNDDLFEEEPTDTNADTQMIDEMFVETQHRSTRAKKTQTDQLSYYGVQFIKTKEMKLISFIFRLCQADDDLEEYEKQYLEVINAQREPLKELACMIEIANDYKQLPNNFTDCTDNIRSLLEASMSLLQCHQTKTFELTVTTLCFLSSYFARAWLHSTDGAFTEDCIDVFNYFKLLYQKGMLYTEQSVISFCKLCLSLLESTINDENDPGNINKKDVLSGASSCFSQLNNLGKASLSSSIADYIRNCKPGDQFNRYSQFTTYFNQPQKSVESSATFNYFISSISDASYSIKLVAICDLLEFSKFKVVKPYFLQSSVQVAGTTEPSQFYLNFKELLFKSWRGFEIPLQQFPYEIFGCESYPELVTTFYKELTAIALAHGDKQAIKQIARINGTTEKSTVRDCISLAYAMAHMTDGNNDQINALFVYYLKKSNKKKFVTEQLILIIFEMIRYCDCTSGSQLLEFATKHGQADIEVNDQLDDAYTQFGMTIPIEHCFMELTTIYPSINALSSQAVYFIMSRILLLLDKSYFDAEKIQYLRKILLMLIMWPAKCAVLNTALLISKNVAKYISDSKMHQDAVNILKCLVEASLKYDDSNLMMVCVPFMNELVASTKPANKDVAEILSVAVKHESTVDIVSGLEDISIVLCQAGLSFWNKSLDFALESAINVIEKVDMSENGVKEILVLLGKILPTVKYESNDSLLSYSLVDKLFKVYHEYGEYLGEPFRQWLGYSVGRYYSMTGRYPEMELYEFDKSLFKWYDAPIFDQHIKKLDAIFKLMISELPKSNLESQIYFELIASVMIFKNNDSKASTDFVSYSEIFSKFEYVYPMNNYLCSLADSLVDDSKDVFYRDSLNTTLKGFIGLMDQLPFEKWVIRIYLAIVNDLTTRSSTITALAVYINRVPSFAIKTLSALVLYYIGSEGARGGKLISNMITTFFARDFTATSDRAIIAFLEMTMLVRIGFKSNLPKFRSVYSVLDQERLFKAALYVKKPKAALMLMEDFYFNKNHGTLDNHLLTKVYSLLDENDLYFGLPASPTLNCAMNFAKHNGKNAGSMMLDNAQFQSSLLNEQDMTSSSETLSRDMLEMGWSGLSSILKQYSDGSGESNDLLYEKSWKLNQWDLPSPESPESEHQAIYMTLKNVKESSREYELICHNSINSVVQGYREFVGLQTSTAGKNFESWCRTLALVVNVEDVMNHKDHTDFSWFEREDTSSFESLILGRKSAFSMLGDTDVSRLGMLGELHRYGEAMRSKEEVQKSLNAAVQANNMVTGQDAMMTRRIAAFDLAASIWMQGEETTFPVVTLKQICSEGDDTFAGNGPQISTGLLHAYIAKWCNESRQETPESIMTNYIEPETQDQTASKDGGRMYEIFAQFCDGELRSEKSGDRIIKLSKVCRRLEHNIHELHRYSHNNLSKSEQRETKRVLKRLVGRYTDEAKELKAAVENRQNYITKAIGFYLKSVILGGGQDQESSIDRFCALWLEHSGIQLDSDELEAVPCHELVSWNNQLTSRLLDETTDFQQALRSLLVRIATNHPFHTFYLLRSLIITRRESTDEAAQSRGMAAEKVWAQLQTRRLNVEGSNTTKVLATVESFCTSAVAVANFDPGHARKKVRLAEVEGGSWLATRLARCQLPSPVAHLPVEKAGPYKLHGMPQTIVGVDTYVTTTPSGISKPKIVGVRLADGSRQKLILKGGAGDLRQDAIMEQVFEKVNRLLARDGATRRRGLRIRTYRVVSLGTDAGVIEFVRNSNALYDILSSLHEKDPISFSDARVQMRTVEGDKTSVRLAVYREITAKIPPAFHVYFFRHFLSPDAWYQARLAYSRGVAATSITGHILGLGDRHCNNILIDSGSGEPVHIDLGVAFDQGRFLTIPETVPFRLTRDMVDGLGVTGVAGVFSRGCEQVLRVLRTHAQYICGILDVLRYDPLYSWTLSPIRRRQLQHLRVENEPLEKVARQDTGSEASLAVEVAKKKLRAGGLSDEAAVRVLVREATDPENLALIFAGWAPYW